MRKVVIRNSGQSTMDIIFEGSQYQIKMFEDADGTNSSDDNVDVEVIFYNGKRYFATFFTLENLHSLFRKNVLTGECKFGLYFWAADMVLVESLTRETVIQTVGDLVARNELDKVFSFVMDC